MLGGLAPLGSVGYNLDLVGNRLSRSSTVAGIATQCATYTSNDWPSSETYDAKGNLTIESTTGRAYDWANRMINQASGAVIIPEIATYVVAGLVLHTAFSPGTTFESANFPQTTYRTSFSKRGAIELSKFVGAQISILGSSAGIFNISAIDSQFPLGLFNQGRG